MKGASGTAGKGLDSLGEGKEGEGPANDLLRPETGRIGASRLPAAICACACPFISTPWPPARRCRGTLVKPGDAGSSEQCTIVVASEPCARLPREALG